MSSTYTVLLLVLVSHVETHRTLTPPFIVFVDVFLIFFVRLRRVLAEFCYRCLGLAGKVAAAAAAPFFWLTTTNVSARKQRCGRDRRRWRSRRGSREGAVPTKPSPIGPIHRQESHSTSVIGSREVSATILFPAIAFTIDSRQRWSRNERCRSFAATRLWERFSQIPVSTRNNRCWQERDSERARNGFSSMISSLSLFDSSNCKWYR